jgi:uncharacterized membrane protein
MGLARFVQLAGSNGVDSPRIAQRLFLAIGAPTILLLCFITGPFEVGDEPAHYMRMVSVADGHWLPVVSPPDAPKKAAGTYEDAAVAGMASRSQDVVGWYKHPHSIAELREKSAVRESGKIAFAAHYESVYPPFLYAGSSAATVVARGAGVPPFWWLYLGRLANALIAILIVQAALRRAGDVSLAMFACAMLPMNLYMFASLSTDALLLPLVFAFSVMLMSIARGEIQSRSAQLALAVSTIFVCVGKVAYLPFALLPPLTMRLVDRRWSRRAMWSVAVALLAFALWLGWAAIVQDKIFSIRPNIQIDAKAQLAHLLSEPLASVRFFLHWMIALTPRLIIDAVGSKLGWGDLHLPFWQIYPLPFLILASALFDEKPDARLPLLAFGAAVTALICYCAVFLLLYLQYNAVGAPNIDGVQGRYFLPLVILLLCVTPRMKVSAARMGTIWRSAAILAGSSSVITLVAAYLRYWGPR